MGKRVALFSAEDILGHCDTELVLVILLRKGKFLLLVKNFFLVNPLELFILLLLYHHLILSLNKVESQLSSIDIHKMHNVNNQHEKRDDQGGQRVVEELCVELHIGVHYIFKGAEITIRAIEIYRTLEPVVVRVYREEIRKSQSQNGQLSTDIYQVSAERHKEVLRKIPLPIADRVDCVIDHSTESEDEELKQNYDEGYSNTDENIVVGVVVAESKLFDSLGDRELAVVGVPALVSPTCQGGEPKMIVPVAWLREALNRSECLQVGVISIEVYFRHSIQARVISGLGTASGVLQQYKVRVRWIQTCVSINLAELILRDN